MKKKKLEQEKSLETIRKLLNKYKEFWFFLAGLILGYVMRALA